MKDGTTRAKRANFEPRPPISEGRVRELRRFVGVIMNVRPKTDAGKQKISETNPI